MEMPEKFSDSQYARHRLCFLEDITKPCAVFIGFKDRTSGIREVAGYNIDRILATVERLREYEIDAVPCFSPMAADPSKTVVTAGGIQTPVLAPKAVKASAKRIMDALAVNYNESMSTSSSQYKGYDSSDFAICAPVEIEQMAAASAISRRGHGPIEPGLLNPDVEEFLKNREEFGFDLEYQLIKEAETSGNLLSLENLRESNANALTRLYRGGALGDQPYLSLASRESKQFSYATPDIKTAAMYSGAGEIYGAKMKAFSSDAQDGVPFGFVYEFEAGRQTHLFQDYGLEDGTRPLVSDASSAIEESTWHERDLETAVLPHKNKLTNVYLHLRKDGQDMFYPIPRDDKRWAAFLQIYRRSDTHKRGYMIARQNRILAERRVFSSLNNNKILGIFPKRVEQINFDGNREEFIRQANMTAEELRQEGVQHKKKRVYSPDEIKMMLQITREKVEQKVKVPAPADKDIPVSQKPIVSKGTCQSGAKILGIGR